MKPINTSFFDFARLIEGGYVYVDKTDRLYELAKPGTDCIYYLPRPRRFGKSLMISTLKALFQGRRELFRGLKIEQTDWDWEKEVYPVLHLDMSNAASTSVEQMEGKLAQMIRHRCGLFGVSYDERVNAATNFISLLDGLPGKSPKSGKYVLLIDEYDAPIAGLLDSVEGRRELVAIRKALHDFYVVAKSHCGDMRFLMVTGVSKFAKTSIFSAFNNPKDLTLDARAADLLGYTHEELETYFHEHIRAFADERGETYDAAFAELLSWYDSYQFSAKRLVKVINPVSLGNALSTRELRGYWEATAGSTLIFDALRAANKTPVDFSDEFSVRRLDAADALTAPTVALLYQGGYLTIDRPGEDDGKVVLKIPNREVFDSLYDGYVAQLLGRDFAIDDFEGAASKTANALIADGVGSKFFDFLSSGFSKLPHDWVAKDEREAKRAFAAFMAFTGSRLYGESQQANGRPDAVLETEKGVYVFEFKFDRTAAAALEQCRERNYAAPYVADPRPVWYVALNYNATTRTLDAPLCERAGESASSGAFH